MSRFATALAIASLSAAPALAESHMSGNAAYAAEEFGQCATCHVIQDDDGTTIAGKRAKTGPNLYCVVGRTAGTYPDFRYGNSIVEAGEEGLVWDEASLIEYLQDPRAFLQAHLDDPKARSKMTFKVRKDGDMAPEEVAAAFAAYLASVCPAD